MADRRKSSQGLSGTKGLCDSVQLRVGQEGVDHVRSSGKVHRCGGHDLWVAPGSRSEEAIVEPELLAQ